MKKIFLICLLIIATQFVFASLPIWWDSDKSNINKKTVDLGAIYNSDKGKDTVDLNFRDISTDNFSKKPIYTGPAHKRCSANNTNNKPVNAPNIICANYFNWFPTGIQDKDPIEADTPIVLSISAFDINPITGDINKDNSDYNFSTDTQGKDTVDLSQTMLGKVSSSDNQNGEYVSAKDKNAEIEKKLKIILLYTPGNKVKSNNLIQNTQDTFIENLTILIGM